MAITKTVGETAAMLSEIHKQISDMVGDMDAVTWFIFLEIAQSPGITVGELLKHAGHELTQAGLSRLLSRLGSGKYRAGEAQGRGIIQKVPKPENRREVQLFVSLKGERLLAKIQQIHVKHCQGQSATQSSEHPVIDEC